MDKKVEFRFDCCCRQSRRQSERSATSTTPTQTTTLNRPESERWSRSRRLSPDSSGSPGLLPKIRSDPLPLPIQFLVRCSMRWFLLCLTRWLIRCLILDAILGSTLGSILGSVRCSIRCSSKKILKAAAAHQQLILKLR